MEIFTWSIFSDWCQLSKNELVFFMIELLDYDDVFFFTYSQGSIDDDWLCNFIENLLGWGMTSTIEVYHHLTILNNPV